MKMLDFLNLLSPAIVPPFDNLVLNDALTTFKVEDISQVPKKKQAEVDEYMKKRTQEMKDEWLRIRYKNASKIITEYCQYKKPAYVNWDKLDGSMGDVYVLAIF